MEDIVYETGRIPDKVRAEVVKIKEALDYAFGFSIYEKEAVAQFSGLFKRIRLSEAGTSKFTKDDRDQLKAFVFPFFICLFRFSDVYVMFSFDLIVIKKMESLD